MLVLCRQLICIVIFAHLWLNALATPAVAPNSHAHKRRHVADSWKRALLQENASLQMLCDVLMEGPEHCGLNPMYPMSLGVPNTTSERYNSSAQNSSLLL